MRPRICLALTALCPAILLSQTTDTQKPEVTRIVRVHRDASALANLLPHGRVGIHPSNELRAILLSGPSDIVDEEEHTIQQLDGISSGGSRNVELLIYVLGGSGPAVSGAPEATGEALSGVVKQLRSVFPYKNYYLLSTIFLRTAQDSAAQNSGFLKSLLQSSAPLPPSRYEVNYNSATASDDPTPVIHLSRFKFDARIPYVSGSFRTSGEGIAQVTPQYQQMDVSTNADLDLREGQKVVVSNSNIEDANSSIFLVLTARLVQ